MSRTWRIVLGCALLAGCKEPEAGEADWSLSITPQTHPNQSPFDGGPTVKLLLRRPSGDEVLVLGTAKPDGMLLLDGLPPASELVDVTTFGIAVEDPGGPTDAIDSGRLRAYGEAPAADLAPGANLDVPVLVSELESIGDLGNLPGAQQRYARAAALVPPGRVFAFTGASELGSPNVPSAVTNDIFVLNDLDAGSPWTFEKLTPPAAKFPTPRLGMSATTVMVDDAPLVVLAGGRPDLWYVSENLADWYLYDPAANEVVDKGDLEIGRSQHQAVPIDNGQVLLVGGWTGDGGTDTDDVELVDPAKGKTTRVSLDLEAGAGSSGASLGTSGALVCGGFRVSGSTATLSSRCQIINQQGAVRDAADLPVPLARQAMTGLGDGRVLVTGGFTMEGPFDSGAEVDATDLAWIYDVADDSWNQLANLQSARSSHTAVALSDGRALVIGGVPIDGVFLLPQNPEGQSCPEVYDPQSGSFRLLQDQCGTWGAGAFPPTGTFPNVGAVIFKGYTVDQEPQDAVGFVGFGPS